MKSILDRSFRYVPSAQTDVAKTFKRIRREMEAKNLAEETANATEAKAKVRAIRKVAK